MPDLRKAATVVPIREGSDNTEVLLLKRNSRGTFGDMWVFPGGAIEAADSEGAPDIVDAARNAAVRETREEAGFSVARDRLLPISHWTPPEKIASRFSTWFFIAPVDTAPEVCVDNREVTGFRWLTAASALAQHENNRLAMAPPTVVTLSEIARYQTCDEIMDFYRGRGVRHYKPNFVQMGEGEYLSLYEDDAGYISGDPDAPGKRDRITLRRGICRYITG